MQIMVLQYGMIDIKCYLAIKEIIKISLKVL